MSPEFKQFLVIASCNLLALSYGMSNFWATINLLELESENTTYPTGPLDEQESALVISIVNVGGLLGNFMVLPISQRIGIKRTIHLLCVPIILSAVLTIWAKNVYYLYVARVLTGIVGGGVVVGIPMFVSDISSDSIRGALNSLYDPFNNCGIIFSFLLGSYLSCVVQAEVQLILPIISMIILFFIPESPEFWTSRNEEKLANKSLQFYKGSLAALHKPDKSDFLPVPQSGKDEKIEKGGEKTLHGDEDLNSPLTFRDFCTPHAVRSLFISFTSLILCYGAGTTIILAYVTYIFKETGSSFSEKHSSILISITQLTANMLFSNIVERFDRKTLFVWSSLLTMASFFLFGAYGIFWLKQPGYEWIPMFCFASIIIFSCMGQRPIPYIVTMEIFPKKIRKLCSTLAVSMLWIILFVLGAIFLTISEMFGLFNFLIVLGVICLVNAIFGLLFIPETRGKSYDEIKVMLSK